MDRVSRLKVEARAIGVYSTSFWHRKCVEPVKRRHGRDAAEWQVHRFEIRGGISLRDAMMKDFGAPNPLFDDLVFKCAR